MQDLKYPLAGGMELPKEVHTVMWQRDCPVCKTHLYKEHLSEIPVYCHCGQYIWR